MSIFGFKKQDNPEISELKSNIAKIVESEGQGLEEGSESKEPKISPEGIDYFGIFLRRVDEQEPMEMAVADCKKVIWWKDYVQNARILAACLEANTPVYLEGPAGAGKTLFAEMMSHSMGMPLYRMNGPKYRMAESLFLEKDVRSTDKGPVTVLTPSPLLMAMRDGGVVLLDEANIIRADTLAELNIFDRNPIKITDLTGKMIEWPDGTIERFPPEFQAHRNFRIILAGNFGRNYHGIKEQNRATLSRFHFVEFERMPIEEIKKMLNNRMINKLGKGASLTEMRRCQELIQPILEIAKIVLQRIEEAETEGESKPELSIYQDMPEISPRDMIRYLYLMIPGLRPDEVMEDYFTKLKKSNPEARLVIMKTFKDYLTPKEK